MKNSMFPLCLIALSSTITLEIQAHGGANTHHLTLEVIVDCPNIEKYKNELSAHNADYERIKSDLRRGLFCSECHNSKTEIESRGITFEAHLKEVKGRAYAATQKMYDEKHQKYLNKFNDIKRNLDYAIQDCDRKKKAEMDRIEAEKAKAAAEAEQQQKLAEAEANRRQKTAEEEAKRADEERKRQLEEAKRLKAEEIKKAEEERLKRLQEEAERRRREEELRQQRLLEFRANMSQLQQLALNAVRTQSQETLDGLRESLAEFKGKLFGKSITYSNPILDEGSQLIETTLNQKIIETVIDDDNFNRDSAERIFSLPSAWKSLKEKDILGFFQGLGFTKPLNYWQNRGLETVDQVGNDLVKDYSSLMNRLFVESNDLDSDQADVMADDVINRVKKNILNIIPGLGDLWYSKNK